MNEPLPPGSRIGILGGGQLGRMLALAAAELGFDVDVFCPDEDCPAGRVCRAHWRAAYEDLDTVRAFAKGVDALTFEFENIPVATVEAAASVRPVRPGARSLELTQDRLIEKQFLRGLGLATAPFAAVDTVADLGAAAASLGVPAILKTRRFGYDGKGQVLLREAGAAALAAAYAGVGARASILEGFVPFTREVSVVLGRSLTGQTLAWDLPENVHAGGTLRTSRVPAAVPAALAAEAVRQAEVIAHALGHVGVLAVEFFVVGEGAAAHLIVNEIAPRVHNSGHWTPDACATGQFAQHIRLVAGWPLAPVTRHADVEMHNLLGSDIHGWRALALDPAVRLHLYGKHEVREGRKMGHATRVLPLR
jgi:5-(carboxyamino)imidazole ribonucleotide synthase